MYNRTVHELIENHNSLGRERPLGLDVKQSPNAQDTFRPIPGLISCAGVTRSVGYTRHACATQIAGLSSLQSHSLVAYSHAHLQFMHGFIYALSFHSLYTTFSSAMYIWQLT